ncbi:hypothetical protein Fot_38178 [Forsythia ovata]|uniref:Uncharacterized protein n=1 Tax=Forsythia ovata TaxID=205694 RepID=A0ABD1S120_9LAMI
MSIHAFNLNEDEGESCAVAQPSSQGVQTVIPLRGIPPPISTIQRVSDGRDKEKWIVKDEGEDRAQKKNTGDECIMRDVRRVMQGRGRTWANAPASSDKENSSPNPLYFSPMCMLMTSLLAMWVKGRFEGPCVEVQGTWAPAQEIAIWLASNGNDGEKSMGMVNMMTWVSQ